MLQGDLLLLLLDYLEIYDIHTLSIVLPNDPVIMMTQSIMPWRLFFPYMKKQTIANIPLLDIGEAEGHTGYIDFIEPNMMSAGIMKGIDRYQRPFISIRFIQHGKVQVVNVFQRYSADASRNFWVTNCTRIRGYEGVLLADKLLLMMLSAIMNDPQKTYRYVHDSMPMELSVV